MESFCAPSIADAGWIKNKEDCIHIVLFKSINPMLIQYPYFRKSNSWSIILSCYKLCNIQKVFKKNGSIPKCDGNTSWLFAIEVVTLLIETLYTVFWYSSNPLHNQWRG